MVFQLKYNEFTGIKMSAIMAPFLFCDPTSNSAQALLRESRSETSVYENELQKLGVVFLQFIFVDVSLGQNVEWFTNIIDMK
jgi:hypothetical protein